MCYRHKLVIQGGSNVWWGNPQTKILEILLYVLALPTISVRQNLFICYMGRLGLILEALKTESMVHGPATLYNLEQRLYNCVSSERP